MIAIPNPLLNLSYFIFGHFVIVHFERRPNNSIAGEVTLSLINLSGKFLRCSASPGTLVDISSRSPVTNSITNLIFIITFVRKSKSNYVNFIQLSSEEVVSNF